MRTEIASPYSTLHPMDDGQTDIHVLRVFSLLVIIRPLEAIRSKYTNHTSLLVLELSFFSERE